MTAHRHLSLTSVAIAACTAAAIAGCGSSSSSDSAKTSSSSSSATGSGYGSSSSSAGSSSSSSAFKVEGTPVSFHSAKTVSGAGTSVELDDNYFKPTVIKGKPGSMVKLELANEGAAEHNFKLDAQHIDKDLEAGKKATVSVKIPAKGRLTFYCKYHVAKGMGGALQSS